MSSYSAKLSVSAWAKVRAFSSRYSRWSIDDDPAGAHQPGRLRGEQAHRPGAEHDHGVAFDDVAELGAEVAGGQRVGAAARASSSSIQSGMIAGPDVGERHPHEFGLAAVVAAAGVRVAVDAADRGGVRVHVVAVRVQPAGAEEARAAVDVERHHHPVAGLEVLHRRSRPRSTTPMNSWPKVMPDPGVGHHPVVEVQVGSADRGQLSPARSRRWGARSAGCPFLRRGPCRARGTPLLASVPPPGKSLFRHRNSPVWPAQALAGCRTILVQPSSRSSKCW